MIKCSSDFDAPDKTVARLEVSTQIAAALDPETEISSPVTVAVQLDDLSRGRAPQSHLLGAILEHTKDLRAVLDSGTEPIRSAPFAGFSCSATIGHPARSAPYASPCARRKGQNGHLVTLMEVAKAMHSRPRLYRRTSKVSRSPLPENPFWLQAQLPLTRWLEATGYDTKTYVALSVGGNKGLEDELAEFATLASHPTYILRGPHGSGKTTQLQRFAKRCTNAEVIIFDGERVAISARSSQETAFLQELLKQLAENAVPSLLARTAIDDTAMRYDIEAHDREFASLRLFGRRSDASLARRWEAIEDDTTAQVQVLLRFVRRRYTSGPTILVVDNIDHLTSAVIHQVVTDCLDLARATDVKIILALRLATERQHRHQFTELPRCYPLNREIAMPRLADVIRQRLEAALRDEEMQQVEIHHGALHWRLRESREFPAILANLFSSVSVENALTSLSNNSLREALRMTLRVLNSHYLDITRLVRSLWPGDKGEPQTWSQLPLFVILKALLLSNGPVYRPEDSLIGNIFGMQASTTHAGPLLPFFILRYLGQGERSVQHQTLVSRIADALRLTHDSVLVAVDWCIQQRWVFLDDNNVELTVCGSYVSTDLSYNLDYLTHISTDVDMPQDLEQKLNAPAANISERLNNLLVFGQAMLGFERHMLREISEQSMIDYFEIFGTQSIALSLLARSIEECQRRSQSTEEGISFNWSTQIAAFRSLQNGQDAQAIKSYLCREK